MKGQQLEIPYYPLPPGIMEKVKEGHKASREQELLEIIEHQVHVIAGFKAGRTKRKKKK